MKKYLFFLLLIISALPQASFAYDPQTTHAGLTEQVVEFYNLNSNVQLNSDDKEVIIQGAVDEDDPSIRALNHFYDPVRGIGINDNRTSLVWATEPNHGNDFTWNANIDKYAKGDREGALIGLGHILHLIEDLTVPDHTRNDPHIGEGVSGAYTGGSPYETWCKENKDRETLAGTALYYKSLGLKPRRIGEIKGYFNNLAPYSNNNYVSADTIENSIYQYANPAVVEKKNGYTYGDDSYFYDRHKLYAEYYLNDGALVRSLINNKTNDQSVIEEYFARLSKMAILSGAGVVELFFTEAEEARAKYLEEEKKKLEDIADYEEEKNEKLTEGGFLSRVWYRLNYALTDTTKALASSISNTAELFGSALYNGGSFAYNATKNTVNSLGFTSTELATISAQKVEKGVQTAKKLVVSTGQKVILYVKENSSNLLTPAVAYTPPTSSPALTPDEFTQLINTLALTTDTDSNEEQVQTEEENHHHSGGGGGNNNPEPEIIDPVSTSTEPTATTTATTTDTGTSTSTATTTATTTIISEPVASPTILSAVNITNTTPTTTILFSGTSTPDFIISNDLDSISTTTDADGNWSLAIENITEGTTTINFFAEPDILYASSTVFDSLTNITTITNYIKSEPSEATVFVGSVSTIGIIVDNPLACEDSLLTGSCLITTTNLEMSWNSNSDKLDHYTIILNDNLDEKIETTATSSVLTLEDNTQNGVEIFAVDTDGNVSDSIITEIIVYSHPVVISEVAWMGTEASTTDEWLELYNLTPYYLSLNGWMLATADGGLNIALENEISARGFYLLERTDDNTVSDMTADLIYGNNGSAFALKNNPGGDSLVLSFASTTIDRTTSGGWPAGNNTSKQTMERRNVWGDGGIADNWIDNDGEHINGHDVSGGEIKGTPRERNSSTYNIVSY